MNQVEDPKILVLSEWDHRSYTDPWGRTSESRVVYARVSIELTGETVERDDGYEIRTDRIWVDRANRGRRFQEAVNHVDMWGGRTWRELVDDGCPRLSDSAGRNWEEPYNRQPYTVNGRPVTADELRTDRHNTEIETFARETQQALDLRLQAAALVAEADALDNK